MPRARDTKDIKWDEYFCYDPSSPTFLRHRYDRQNVKGGAVAGTINNKTGYVKVRLFNKIYAGHRIVWEMFNNRLNPDDKIDHIDGCVSNNALDNLRVVPEYVNQRNKRMYKNNATGFTGVSYNKTGYWVATWYEGFTCRTKYFSISKFDYITAKTLAINWRATKLKILNSLGDGYTKRHGFSKL